jgi:uncharacterized surface protein with fasciclin (FAS1) repeats
MQADVTASSGVIHVIDDVLILTTWKAPAMFPISGPK